MFAKLKNFIMSRIDLGRKVLLLCMFAAISFGTSLMYAPLNIDAIHNPFTVLVCFFVLYVIILLITKNYKGISNAELKRAVTFGPLKLITALVIIACTMPSQSFLLLLVPGAVICLIFAGLGDLFTAVRCVWDSYQDHKAFNNAMKETAQTARVEEALSSDLADFLSNADSAGKQNN